MATNTPVGKLSQCDDSHIRKAAIKYKVTYVTTLAAAKGITDRRAAPTQLATGVSSQYWVKGIGET